MPSVEELLETAERAARAAGEILARRFARGDAGDARWKGPRSLVTEADTEAEAAVVETIRAAYPDHGIVAEEGGGAAAGASGAAAGASGAAAGASGAVDLPAAGAGAPVVWHVDPLDGTANFARGIPHFCVSVGALDAADRASGEADRFLAGVVYDPLRDEIFTATAGGPARRNGVPIRASRAKELSASILATGFAIRRHETDVDGPLADFAAVFRASEDVRRMGSAALDLVYVACGRFDGFWEAGLSSWDLAAGVGIARRAGAVATDFSGGAAILESGTVVVAAPGIHAALLGKIRGSK